VGASNDHTVRVWGAQSGRVKHILTGHTGKALSARFTADSQKIISGSHDRTLKLWDLTKGYCVRTIFCYSSCNSTAVAKDGRMITSAHLDNNVRFWDVKNGECVHEADVHSGQVTSVDVSPDGEYVLSNSRDNTLELLDIRSYTPVHTFSAENYRNGVNWNHACFSPDGEYVAAGGNDGSLHVWRTQTGKLEVSLKNTQTANIVNCCAWSPTGLQVTTAQKGGTVVIWTRA